jgi:hypothetical protein
MLLTQVNIVHTEKLSPTKTIEKVLGEEEKTEDALIFWAFEQCSKGLRKALSPLRQIYEPLSIRC